MTRNNYIHPTIQPSPKVMAGDELVLYTRALGWLVRAALIVELGMSRDDLLERLRETDAAGVAEAMAALGG